MLLSNSLQTVFIVFGAVLVVVGLVGTKIKVGSVDVTAPDRYLERVLMALVGLIICVGAVVNPTVHRFAVVRVGVYVTPRNYRGPCPVGIELVGIVRAKNGSAKVTSSLYLASAIGAGTREIRMGDGETVQRTVVVQKSVKTRAWYIVIAPNRLGTSYPVKVVCTTTAR